jgi:hypothetical protein
MPAGWAFGPAGIETLAPYPRDSLSGATGYVPDGESVIRLFSGLFALALGA